MGYTKLLFCTILSAVLITSSSAQIHQFFERGDSDSNCTDVDWDQNAVSIRYDSISIKLKYPYVCRLADLRASFLAISILEAMLIF